ncbi:type III-A CRISPR-associated protein Cas10/Csm1 [Thomasclavelia spiroformis]|uniref:CRISPR system single-strand-specific deoxyribonuclease Cas10/Csm1 (subtype III-A) n=1 Tax=Thomasclavelia spiroformis TaxID=29348 RepID=A0A921GCQ6_9FIRM|nr:type III-A CRISPR-associated protein Cas10/Csm1 [Thomasclavelia spiroformis]HJF41383.1 type III-A CRISPR-associated protein Cas10/Csm1 [Thomasclavelia spiroformis]
MEDYKLIDVAYGALLHDIGKFYQRTYEKSDLSKRELETTRYHKNGNYHSHLHSGYTSRFLNKYLEMNNEFEKLTSEHHHIDESEHFLNIIKKADQIASAIDRQDELKDNEAENKKGSFITARLYSVLSEVHFGKEKNDNSIFSLSTRDQMNIPDANFVRKSLKESVDEYKILFDEFADEIEKNIYLKKRVNFIAYNYMYNLLNKYLVTVPASTYGGVKSAVSLFDHLKISSAIASCLYDKTCYDQEMFYMLEIDVSGIQSFIYQVVEGSGTKPGLSKALRGRSILVGLITNAISYAFLNEFGLTVSNILFNTGGGSMILLPYNQSIEKRVMDLSKKIRKSLFDFFQTDITFVNAMLPVNKKELETFQTDKAIELKSLLGRNKMRKYQDIIDDADFFFDKIDFNSKCNTCGRVSKSEQCFICKMVEKISQIYTKNESFGIVYDFNKTIDIKNIETLDLGFVRLLFINDKSYLIDDEISWYVDSINNFGFGNEKMLSSQVPLNNYGDILNFEQIIKLTSSQYGDEKLAILKMDVDNLGGIFAFGLKASDEPRVQRSISKYVTMSRLMEFFFGHEIKNICREVSLKINENIDDKVKNGTMFYINYAGGDDLVIIGSVYSIVELALEIHKRFAKFTNNKNITISGGINFQNDKKPIRFGVQMAEEALSMSKDGDKNAITLLNTTVPFVEFEELLVEVKEICKFILEGKLSRTMLFNLMSNIRDKSYMEFVCLIPRIQYILYRNVKDQKLLDSMRYRLTKVKTDIDVKHYVLILKLVMLFTRENKEE